MVDEPLPGEAAETGEAAEAAPGAEAVSTVPAPIGAVPFV